jgi:hypothetical protein
MKNPNLDLLEAVVKFLEPLRDQTRIRPSSSKAPPANHRM